MIKQVTCSTLLVTLLFVCSMSRTVHLLAQDHRANACADVNRDDRTNLSDAVYLLNWLFLAGPQPECPSSCTPPASYCSLPASGETLCWDSLGNEIPCDSEEWPRQVALYRPGCGPEGRFVVPEDDATVVVDTCTGLMWQLETAPGTYNWQTALQYCAGFNRGGHDNWRLPGFREIQSLTLHSPSADLYIDPLFDAVPSWYWSSSTSVEFPRYAAAVDFGTAFIDGFDKNDRYNVRAVRTMEPGE